MKACRNGTHQMTPENSFYRADRDSYECRACRNDRTREHKARLRAALRQLKELGVEV